MYGPTLLCRRNFCAACGCEDKSREPPRQRLNYYGGFFDCVSCCERYREIGGSCTSISMVGAELTTPSAPRCARRSLPSSARRGMAPTPRHVKPSRLLL